MMNDQPNMPNIQILKQGIKTINAKNLVDQTINASFSAENAPQISVNIFTDAQDLGSEQYEVKINLTANAGYENVKLFDLEICYAALFTVQNVSENDIEPMLLVYCPSVIFPFLRRIVADVTRDLGFPPLMLEIVDFFKLYQEGKNRQIN